MNTQLSKSALAVIVSTLIVASATAQAETTLPPLKRNGPIEYLSGGIGQDESSAIMSASPHWPLTLEFAVKNDKHADYSAGVQVTLRDIEGPVKLSKTTDGPFLLAKLPSGTYLIDATLSGQTLHRKVLIERGHPLKLIFMWPKGTGETRS